MARRSLPTASYASSGIRPLPSGSAPRLGVRCWNDMTGAPSRDGMSRPSSRCAATVAHALITMSLRADLAQQPTITLPHADRPWIHIEPSRGWIPINLRELWQYRELVYFLCWRDVKARYKQTALGV